MDGTEENKEHTARPLVKVDEATSQAQKTTEPHGLRKATLSNVGRRKSLHGQEQTWACSGCSNAMCVVRRPSIPHHTLEVPRQRFGESTSTRFKTTPSVATESTHWLSSKVRRWVGRRREELLRVIVDELGVSNSHKQSALEKKEKRYIGLGKAVSRDSRLGQPC